MAERVAQGGGWWTGPADRFDGPDLCGGAAGGGGVRFGCVGANVHRGGWRQHRAPRVSGPVPTRAQANAYATSELSGLSVQEKFGQLTMAGPTTPLGTLEQQACDGQVGSVLDLTGVAIINAVQRARDGAGL